VVGHDVEHDPQAVLVRALHQHREAFVAPQLGS
jgi:hypothetical protein